MDIDLERVETLWRMAEEYDDESYDGPAWLRALGQLDVSLALKMERADRIRELAKP
jgi:hypothetical protein